MVKCPKCGNEVPTPVKTWPIPSRKPPKMGERSELAVGIFECPECKARFRASLETEKKPEETTNIRNVVERIKIIRGEFVLTLRNLRDKIKTLETERATLMNDIENLRRVAESRASALESEVDMLKDELKSLRELFDHSEETEK